MKLGDSKLSILEHVYQRLCQSKNIDKVVFAIPDTALNEQLASFMEGKNIPYTRGSEDDVLDRFYQCAVQYDPEVVVRATCDNPLVDWTLCDQLIDNLGDNDYIGATDVPLGTGVEVFKMSALREAHEKACTEPQHEHVTPYMYQNLKYTRMSFGGLDYRLTVDEERDYYVMNELYSKLYNGSPIPNREVYAYLVNHPELATYNQEVHQKKLGE